MLRNHNLLAIPITILSLALSNVCSTRAYAASNNTGTKGAQIYCYLRANGNTHEVSWQSAYEVIKRQTTGLFKTSPKHGAVMILEAVVDNPHDYDDCGQYLGELFGASKEDKVIDSKSSNSQENNIQDKQKGDRYSY